ncbi:MAG: AAA family ATPase, partial [Paludibacteraceae bacterium]|nr:AAA family ATPase [Paludibacteraceae bacterium]
PDVFNILLQVLDDGRLTDGKGRTVNFKNTIIIMTSNLGSQLIREKMESINDSNRAEVLEKTRSEVFTMLKQVIKPEFLNRIDDLIMFTPLNKEEIRKIVKLQVGSIAKLLQNNGIELKLTDAAIDYIATAGYDPQFGARPVKRALQNLVLNELSEQIIAGKVDRSKPITVDFADGQLKMDN